MTVKPTVSNPGPEREPEPLIHYDTDTIELRTACGLILGYDGSRSSLFPAAVTCPQCAATLVDGQLADPVTAEVYAEHFPERDDAGEPRTDWAAMSDDELEGRLRGSLQAAVEHEGFADVAPPVGPTPAAESYAVRLEVLTDELRALAQAERDAGLHELGRDPQPIPADTRVGVVVRVGGQPVQVPDLDTDWTGRRTTTGVLAELLMQASYYVRDGAGETVEMPGVDVLAALSGRPVGAYTAPIKLRADQVDVGWSVCDWADEGDQLLVRAVLECEDVACPWGADCCVVVAEGVEPVHFAPWQDLTVRIPAVQA